MNLDHQRIVHSMGESLLIKRHVDCLLWLQGDFQYFVPHEIFIGAWGQFATRDVCLDLVSPHHDVRTHRLADCAAAHDQECPVHELVGGLFQRWLDHDRHGLVLTTADGLRLGRSGCRCPLSTQLQRMRGVLVHGMKDKRAGHDCLYIALHSEPIPPAAMGPFHLLLPYVDAALRRVRQLPSQVPMEPPEAASGGELAAHLGLSAREAEIVRWVCLGKTNIEIGMILGISAFTVKNHLQRIFRKLDVSNRAQAVAKFEGKALSFG
jgi:transcriptional regulator EpsA